MLDVQTFIQKIFYLWGTANTPYLPPSHSKTPQKVNLKKLKKMETWNR